jgi:NADPH:quinone reductase-like Zn-dependent oxidoreductase
VRVAVRAAGVNPVDWKLDASSAAHVVHALLGPAGPLVCGIDFAGVVLEVGGEARGVAVGDHVVGAVDFRRRQRGSYATEVVVTDGQLVVLPKHADLVAASCLPIAGVTAHASLFAKGRLAMLDRAKVLVLGAAGGVGHMTLQLARGHAAEVYGVCSTRNAAFVTRFGAIPITHDDGDVFAKARALGPFDIIVNAVDTDRYPVSRVGSLLSARGRQVLLNPHPLDYPSALRPSVHTFNAFPLRETLAPVVDAYLRGALEVVIAERFPLTQAARAHERSKSGTVVGKLVLLVGDDARSASATDALGA